MYSFESRSQVRHLKHSMWHYNEDCYEKRRRKSLFYTTVEAETLLQNNARVGLWHLMVIPFLVLIKRNILLPASVMESTLDFRVRGNGNNI